MTVWPSSNDRAHKEWLETDIASRTVEDRLAMYKKFYPDKMDKFTREEERKTIEKGGPSTPLRPMKGEEGAVQPSETGGRTEQENKTEFKHDRENSQEENPAGKIEKITIGVLIPIEVGPDGKELIEAEKQKGKC